MKGTMELFKVSTNWRQSKSMESNKCKSGEEASIFPHLLLISMMKDILRMIEDMQDLNLKSFH